VIPTGDSYIELLPAVFRIVNDYGLTIDNRTYDCQPSALPTAGLGLSGREQEEMGGPLRSCDITVVWLRDHREDKWIIVPWVYRSPSGPPFGLLVIGRGRIIADREDHNAGDHPGSLRRGGHSCVLPGTGLHRVHRLHDGDGLVQRHQRALHVTSGQPTRDLVGLVAQAPTLVH
jgi:hypothetical protein